MYFLFTNITIGIMGRQKGIFSFSVAAATMSVSLDSTIQSVERYETVEFVSDDSYSNDKRSITSSEHSVDAHGPVSSDTSTGRTFVNFAKSYIGSGVLGLPYAFYQGGALVSIVSVIFLALLSNYCIRLLLVICDELESQTGKKVSFGGIGSSLFGKKGRFLVDFFLIFTQTGFCCAYVVFISENLVGIYPEIPNWGYVILLMPFLILVCWVRSFTILAYSSFVGQLTMIVGMVIVMVFSLISAVDNTPEIKAVNLLGLPVFFGIAVYSFEGIGLVIPMRRAMTKPLEYTYVLDIGFIFITGLFVAFGTIGYCGYGANVNSSAITLNLPADSIWTLIAEICLIFAIFATYPVQMFPVFGILEGIAYNNTPLAKLKGYKLTATINLGRALLVIFTSIIAISVPYFSLFVSLVGATGSSSLAYILPCIFHLKLFTNANKKIKALNWFTVIFGIIAASISTVVTLYQLVIAIFGLTPPF